MKEVTQDGVCSGFLFFLFRCKCVYVRAPTTKGWDCIIAGADFITVEWGNYTQQLYTLYVSKVFEGDSDEMTGTPGYDIRA